MVKASRLYSSIILNSLKARPFVKVYWSTIPKFLVLDKEIKQELDAAKPAPAETYSARFRPRF